jgi:HEAT repeat protein
VEPPSAGFIVQLFVIPAVIVAVVIVVWLLFGKLAGGERDAMWYVQTLKSTEANYRSAYELGSLIRNDPKIAADGKLLGELTDLLASDLTKETDEKLLVYLTAALGVFTTLDATDASGKPVDVLSVLRSALTSSKSDDVRKSAALSLASHAARLEGMLDDAATIAALVETKKSESADVRKIAVFTLGFFCGEPAALGLRDRLNDPDRDVRYNAAAALARRGDLAAKGFLEEMLSPTDLETALASVPESERRSQIEAIQDTALESIRKGVVAGKVELAQALRPKLDALTRSGLVSVRTQAQEIMKSLPADSAN